MKALIPFCVLVFVRMCQASPHSLYLNSLSSLESLPQRRLSSSHKSHPHSRYLSSLDGLSHRRYLSSLDGHRRYLNNSHRRYLSSPTHRQHLNQRIEANSVDLYNQDLEQHRRLLNAQDVSSDENRSPKVNTRNREFGLG